MFLCNKKAISIIMAILLLMPTLLCSCFGESASSTQTTVSNTQNSTSITTEAVTEQTVTTSSPVVTPIPTVEPVATDVIKLSEIMASNSNVISDSFGDFSDWIELYNSSDSDVDLTGYTISDDPSNPYVYTFDGVVIKANSYLVLFASGRNMKIGESEYHLPFKVSKTSAVISLYNPAGSRIGRINIENIGENVSCGLNSTGEDVIFAYSTPNAENTSVFYKPGDSSAIRVQYTIRINEYATNDCINYVDSNGDFVAWVEIYNYGNNPVNLKGLFLSDDITEKNKWAFPDVTVAAGEYIIVVMNSNEVAYTEGNEIQADFTLSGKEDTLGVYTGSGDTVDQCNVFKLVSNLSYGRSLDDPEKWYFFATSSPLKPNTYKGFESIDSANFPSSKILVINEVVAVNKNGLKASDGNRYDYVELYNASGEDINLSQYYISKSTDPEKMFQLPNMVLKAHSYQIIFFGANKCSYNSKKGEIYITAKLNRYSNDLYIYNEDNVAVDSLVTGRLFESVSMGRASSLAINEPVYFTFPTPASRNAGNALTKITKEVSFSVAGGYVDENTSVTLTGESGAKIYYTTDGSKPTEFSNVYTTPIVITETTIIRAIAIKPGCLPSDDMSESYLVGRTHSLPVVFISTENDLLYSEEYGILTKGANASTKFPYKGANFWKDIEIEARFDYFEADGTHAISSNIGMRIFGQYSRAADQKSLAIFFKDKYGAGEICYPFFEDCDVNVFSSLVLRAGGQDSKNAYMRDDFVARAVEQSGIDLDYMSSIYVVVYINGEYHGLCTLREKVNEDYLSNHYGIDTDNVDIIKANKNVVSGSYNEYQKLVDFLNKNSLANAENYAKACEMVDVDNLINYWICETFFCNTDTGNIKFYKENKEGAKWRWVLFDMDWSLFPSTYASVNMIKEVLDPAGHGVGNSFSTLVLRSFMKNSEFKDRFLTLYGQYMNTVFSEETLLALIDEMQAEISDEMVYHIEKWGGSQRWTEYGNSSDPEKQECLSAARSYSSWQNNVNRIRNAIKARKNLSIKQLTDYFKLSDDDVQRYFGSN